MLVRQNNSCHRPTVVVMEQQPPPRLLNLLLARDSLSHFSRDGPYVRLTALFVCKLPYIITAIGGVVVSLCKLLGKL